MIRKAEEQMGEYKLAEKFIPGNRYIIATEYKGDHYGFAFINGALVIEKIELNGDGAAEASDAAKWTFSHDESIESVGTPGMFVYAGSFGLMTFSTGRTFIYNAESKHVFMHKLYYLTFNGANFGVSKEETDACDIVIFEKEMPKVAVVKKYIPDGSALPSISRKSLKNADGSITLAFVSDVHHAISYPQNNLLVWLNNIKSKIGYIDAMGFCGDTGSAYSRTAKEYWENTQCVIDEMDAEVESGYMGNTIYTFGNHEWYPFAGGDYMNNYENNPAADRFLRIGEGLKTDDYIFYCFGSGSIAAKMGEGYSEEDIARIDTYLATAPTDIPIFVLTHFPLHFWSDKLSENADKLAAVLNKYPNVVMIWGHNHSSFDEYYDKVYRAGDVIIVDSKGTEVELNFTYLSAGCISDAEYTGASGGSAWVLGKGLIVTIGSDGKLSFDYYTMDGDILEENGPYFVEYRDGIKYETIKTEYVEAGNVGTPPEVLDVINFKFVGWDREVNAINNHTVVTAKYEYITNLNPDYVYFTVQEGDGIAVGKSGAAILQYAIPFAENMTAIDALKALHDAEYEGGSDNIGTGDYGTLSCVWGHSSTNGTCIMEPANGRGYIYNSEKLIGGRSYYVYAHDDDDIKDTSYLSPFVNNITVGEQLTMKAEYWRTETTTYGYTAVGLEGDVFAGTALDNLVDTGINATNGIFDIAFNTEGTYYVAVKSENAGLAVNIVNVED